LRRVQASSDRQFSHRPTLNKLAPGLTASDLLLRSATGLLADAPFRMYHSAMWPADDPEYPVARKRTQSRGTIDNTCVQKSYSYNCRPSLPEPDNASRIRQPPPFNAGLFEIGIPRLMSGPSDQSTDIPGILTLRTRDDWWEGGTDHGRFRGERSRFRKRIGDDQAPRDREPSTPSAFSQRFRLPPIHTLRSSEPLLREPAGFRPGFFFNAPPPQVHPNPSSWPYVYVTLRQQHCMR
jgi:hypothetical protein